MTDALLTSAEVARLLRVSEAWVWKHAAKRARPYLPAIRLTGERKTTYRFVEREIEEWLKGLMK